MNYLTVCLDKEHKNLKKGFSCGKDMLDNYLKNQANQDISRKISVCFVLIHEESGLLSGYYTLSNFSIPLDDIPEDFKKQLPASYSSIPTTLLGRLAVDNRLRKQGIGEKLLLDALKRSFDISLSVGSFAVIVDPLDAEAVSFYLKYGFIILPDSGRMFLPMKTIADLFD